MGPPTRRSLSGSVLFEFPQSTYDLLTKIFIAARERKEIRLYLALRELFNFGSEPYFSLNVSLMCPNSVPVGRLELESWSNHAQIVGLGDVPFVGQRKSGCNQQ